MFLRDTFLNLEKHCSVTELFCSSILFWLIIFEVCQCLENNVQMPLASDQLYLPALAHISVVAYTKKKVVFLATLWHFIAYQLKGEYLQGHFICAWKTEGGQLCAGMVHQGAMFCKPACITFHRLQTRNMSQTHPFDAQLRNSPPSHSAQQQPAGFVGLVSSEEPVSGHPHV